MAKFNGHLFCSICAHLSTIADKWEHKKDDAVPPAERHTTIKELRFIADECEESGIVNAAGYIRDGLGYFEDLKPLDTVLYARFAEAFGNLQLMIKSEMKRVEYLRVERPNFYGTVPLFDPFITDIYSQLSYDIVEAGNCLALERSTACVFHLMRIMEFGVQRFGHKIGVPHVNETNWQSIMNQVDSRIRVMPDKPAIKKRRKEQYSEVAGHLYNVKVSWRNPVMHPKRTYTPEEAERIFVNVKMFMGNLLKLIQPRKVATAIAERQRLITAYDAMYGLGPSKGV